jgi:hypothetical protein
MLEEPKQVLRELKVETFPKHTQCFAYVYLIWMLLRRAILFLL